MNKIFSTALFTAFFALCVFATNANAQMPLPCAECKSGPSSTQIKIYADPVASSNIYEAAFMSKAGVNISCAWESAECESAMKALASKSKAKPQSWPFKTLYPKTKKSKNK